MLLLLLLLIIINSAAAFLSPLRGWRNTAGSLIGIVWLKQTYRGPRFTGMCVKHGGVRLRRIRGFKRYYCI